MFVKPLKQIHLNENVTITVNVLGQVYFNDYILTKISEKVNLDKFEKLVITDERLHQLIAQFMTAEKVKEYANKKQDEIREMVEKEISKTRVKGLDQFHFDEDCWGVIEIRTPEKFVYKGHNFIVETVNKKFNLSCFVLSIDHWFRKLSPNLKVKVVDDGKYVSISLNDTLFIVSDEFDLAKVLGFFAKVKALGKFPKTVDLFNEYLDYERQKTFVYHLFHEIQRRVKELAKASLKS